MGAQTYPSAARRTLPSGASDIAGDRPLWIEHSRVAQPAKDDLRVQFLIEVPPPGGQVLRSTLLDRSRT